MQKLSRIVASRSLSVCPLSISLFPAPPFVPSWVFGHHSRRRMAHYHPVARCSVYLLPGGWYVWCHRSGLRQLVALPF